MDAQYRPRLTREEMERRRLLAAEDLRDGVPPAEVARAYGVHKSNAGRWAAKMAAEGVDGLRRTKASGKSRLSRDQLERLLEILIDGALAWGFETDLWTGERVAEVIREEFDVHYSPRYIPQLLREKLHMSYQKPQRLARERDDEARAAWLQTEWPAFKKSSKRKTSPSPSSTKRGSDSRP